jgi:dihydrofolate synthase/folylpolyglutamate synthase
MNAEKYIRKLSRTEYTGVKADTHRIRSVLEKLGRPQDCFPSVHISGTNGKGSTAAMTASVLSEAGYRVGLYTSPHLVDERERIRINGKKIDRGEFIRCLSRVLRLPESRGLTYFELMTAAGFLHFALSEIDILVCETGLGGTYDATNVMDNVLVSIITKVDYDHTEILGKSLAKIAAEKAGIIREDVPVVSARQYGSVRRIIALAAGKKKNGVSAYGTGFFAGRPSADWNKLCQTFDFIGKNFALPGVTLRLMGRHQIENASLAIETSLLLRRAGMNITGSDIREGLLKTRWPARLEFMTIKHSGRKIRLLIDGAHNPGGAGSLARALSDYRNGEKFIFVFAAMRDKNYSAMIDKLSPYVKKAIIFRPDNPRAAPVRLIKRAFERYLPKDKIVTAEDFNAIIEESHGEGEIVVAGSLYLAGQILEKAGRVT